MNQHIFVDETKDRAYLLVASVHVDSDLNDLRAVVRGLVMKGQRRLHMKKESESRKRAIADALCNTGLSCTIYDAGRRYRAELDARAACLRALVNDVRSEVSTVIVLEQDDSLLASDRRLLYDLTRTAPGGSLLRYEHARASTEQLLGIPDAIAWCWAKGGHWRRRIEPLVTTVRQV